MKLRLLMFFAVLFTFQAMSYSLVAPLYPSEAQNRGVSIAITGMVIGSYSIMYIVTAIICESSEYKI